MNKELLERGLATRREVFLQAAICRGVPAALDGSRVACVVHGNGELTCRR